MGIDAQGWFDIEGTKITEEYLAGLTARFIAADFDVRANWFRLQEGYVELNFDLGRYYGIGYERGNFSEYLPVLGWLLRNLPPGGRVFYGGDCSDMEDLCQWTFEREKAYLDHYLRVGHEPYRRPT